MTVTFRLADLIGAEFAGEDRRDLASVTGARTDLEVERFVDAVAARKLGSDVRGALFAKKSVGVVFGLELVSGERVVLKLFHPSQSLSELTAAHRCLEHVATQGFPATPLRSSLFQAEDGMVAAFYAFEEGERGDGHEPDIRRELARSFVELHRLLESADPTGLPLAPTRRRELWPASHRSYLSLDEDKAAKWIDDRARRAQNSVRATRLALVPCHLDWGVKNIRFRDGRVSVVYDWDSLHAASEPEAVGRAAAQFTAQWDFPARPTPTPAEARAFVEEYESARGRSFSAEEREVVAASAEYLVAQVARIELAGGVPESDNFVALLRSTISLL
jgi:Ser/Thr protein kinase RdoA (MazF antagonist)